MPKQYNKILQLNENKLNPSIAIEDQIVLITDDSGAKL